MGILEGGGGSADFIFMGVGIFPHYLLSGDSILTNFWVPHVEPLPKNPD